MANYGVSDESWGQKFQRAGALQDARAFSVCPRDVEADWVEATFYRLMTVAAGVAASSASAAGIETAAVAVAAEAAAVKVTVTGRV